MWLLVVMLVLALLFLPGLYALTAAKTPRPAPPLRPWRLAVSGVWGRRSWALLGLPFAWLLIGLARIWVHGGLDLQHNNGEILGGLTLATWALLLLSVASAAGTFIRLAERRAAAQPGPYTYATVVPPPP